MRSSATATLGPGVARSRCVRPAGWPPAGPRQLAPDGLVGPRRLAPDGPVMDLPAKLSVM
ncbi:MAG TPA: hypothetical protein VFN08_09255 [Gemmatimonadales bacterium]|nr:hypothetical protein [Gemmatimonadales bacterium]